MITNKRHHDLVHSDDQNYHHQHFKIIINFAVQNRLNKIKISGKPQSRLSISRSINKLIGLKVRAAGNAGDSYFKFPVPESLDQIKIFIQQ